MILITSLYFDGEVKSIEGYVKEEEIAKKKVKELNDTVANGASYYYVYEILNELV